MGAYLSTPVTSTKSDDFIDSNKYICGLSGMQGWRISMEVSINCYYLKTALFVFALILINLCH